MTEIGDVEMEKCEHYEEKEANKSQHIVLNHNTPLSEYCYVLPKKSLFDLSLYLFVS
jgi:hypothetical protein